MQYIISSGIQVVPYRLVDSDVHGQLAEQLLSLDELFGNSESHRITV